MLKQEPWAWLKGLFSRGARPDADIQLRTPGFYENAQNMRLNATNGTAGSLEKIGGEELYYRVPNSDLIPIADTYRCIGACSVTGVDVAVWASINGLVDPQNFPPLITGNGILLAMSPLIPYRHDRPLQFGDVSRCVNGVVYPADGYNDALFWDIGAMQTALTNNTLEFFANFNLQSAQVLPAGPTFWFEHTGLPQVGVGLPPGQYLYWPRLVFPSGDRSNFGPPTPPICVPRVQSPYYGVGSGSSGQYPSGQTVGGDANPDTQVPTQYGVELRFQVDNFYGATEIEVVRQRFNNATGLNGPGIVEVIARISITPGQFSEQPLVFTDPQDQNFFEVIPNDEAVQQQVNFTAPKTVEYFDNRIGYGNFRRRLRIAALVFREVAGQRLAAITNRVFTWYNGQKYDDGHGDPVNNTYMKGACHNERQSFGVMMWDGTATRSYVTPMQDNFLYPGRRARKIGQNLLWSYNRNDPYGTDPDPIYAADENAIQTTDPIAPTFDAIVQGSTPKVNDSFTNVTQGLNYNPFAPTSPTDTNYLRYRQKPVTGRVTDGTTILDDSGRIFANQYHALGVAFYGPDNIDAEAPWWQVMDIMVTPTAGRVVCEGQAAYELEENEDNPNTINRTKRLNQLRCFFPDLTSGLVPENIQNDLAANPQNYRLRLTPYGFYGEPYAYRNRLVTALGDIIAGGAAIFNVTPTPLVLQLQVGDSVSGPGIPSGAIITGFVGTTVAISLPATSTQDVTVQFGRNAYGQDVITYATMQFEPGNGQAGSVNIGDTAGTQGFQPGASAPLSPTNYIAGGAWRGVPVQGITNTAQDGYSVFLDPNNTAQGAIELQFDLFEVVPEGRGFVYRIRTNDNVYIMGGHDSGPNFSDAQTRRFHEGLYNVQIIRSEAEVEEQNIQQYQYTGTRVARERCIALGRPTGEVFTTSLFQVRVEDCVPRPGSGELRYVFVQEDGQGEKPFICFTNAAIDFAAAIAAFSAGLPWVDPNGVTTYGAYSYTFDNQSSPRIIHRLTFGDYGTAPAEGARILVRYQKTSPIQTFGFDCTTAPWVFAPYDRRFNANAGYGNGDGNTQIFNGAPLPYNGGTRASLYILPRDGGSTTDPASEEPSTFNGVVSLRQWVVYGVLTTRTPGFLNTSSGLPEQWAFPHRHYVIRPSLVSSYVNGEENGLNSLYDEDYPNEVPMNYPFGGFQFVNGFNLDYARQRLITGLGVPRNGQFPNDDLCTGIIVSLQKEPGAVDSPGLQTFLEDNLYTISEENGEIKLMSALDQGGFQQLWVWTEKGLCRIPYNKNILVGADGNVIGTQSYSQFWPREEMWKYRGTHGMPAQMWRMSALGTGEVATRFWTDRVSWYQLIGGEVRDLAREDGASKFLSVIQPLLSTVAADYGPGYASMFNRQNGEVWFSVPKEGGGSVVHVYSAISRDYVGTFTYEYDSYLNVDTRMMGFRNLVGNQLDQGFDLITPTGTVPVEAWAETTFAPRPSLRSEFVSWRVSPDKPTEIRIYDSNHQLMVTTNEAINGPLWVKYVDSWQQLAGRCDAAYVQQFGIPRMRPQDLAFYLRVMHSESGSFTLTFCDAQFKPIA